VGGKDLVGMNRVNWLDAVALVGQEPVLFAGSVAVGAPSDCPPRHRSHCGPSLLEFNGIV